MIKNVCVKLFSFINGESIGDQNVSAKFYSFFNGGRICDEERVWQTLQFLQWRQYWWSRTCLSNSTASSMEGVLMIKNVSLKLVRFINGRGSIGDKERVCQTLLLLQWSVCQCIGEEERVCQTLQLHWNGGSIGDQERVCQTLWREYWWSRTCLSNSLASSMEGVLMIKNVSLKLVSFINGVGIGDEERACQTLLLIWRREYWWSRTYLSNSSASSMEGVLVIKNVSVKLFSFINVGSIGDQERVCQTLQLHQWREYWWSKRVCQILQLLQRRENLWWRTCLANSSVSSVEAVLVMKNVSLKLVSFINGGSIGDQERVCQTLQLLFCRDYWWSRTCLSNSSASLVDGVLMIKNVSVKIFSFINGGGIGDEERACQTLLLI